MLLHDCFQVSITRRLLTLLLIFGFYQPATTLAAETEKIRIISTNDIHSYLRPLYYRNQDEPKPWGIQSLEGDYVAKSGYEGKIGGMAYVSTVINRFRSEKPGKTLVIDTGDTWQGSGISVFDKGVTMVKIMNKIGYDVMVPGNWEYFYSREHLLDLIDQADFPVIAFNLADKEWGDPVLDQYVIKKVGNLKIAILGLTYPWTALTSSIAGSAKWWQFGIKENVAEELIAQLRAEEDPDLILFISHGGYGLDQKFVQRVEGIDMLISGHTHNPVIEPVVWNNTIVYETGSHGELVSSIDIEVKDKKIVSYNFQLAKVYPDYLAADPEIEKLVEQAYSQYAEKLGEVIGYTEGMIYRRDYWQSTLGNLLTDVLRSTQGTDISLFPAWRYGATLMPGEITIEDVYNIIPTGGRVITYTMAGKQIRTLLENILDGLASNDAYSRVGGDMIRFSGLKIVYDLGNARGERIVSMTTSDGQQFLADKDYSVASVNTRFQDNPLFGARNVVDTGKVFADELIKYIRVNSPLRPMLDGRITS